MAVTREKIRNVRTEIERLLQRFDELDEVCEVVKTGQSKDGSLHPIFKDSCLDNNGEPYLSHFPKETGAIRRSSMDLTRALAKLRSSKE